jgi:predicted kinase
VTTAATAGSARDRAPRLILLNGLPAVGKTTLARRYAEDHALTLVVELDTLRRLLGRWQDDPATAGLLARALSLPMALAHLRGGRDVVVPQFLARPEFIGDLESLASQSGARFLEFVLTDDRDALFGRFSRRTARPAEPAHVDAGWIVDRAGGVTALGAMHDRLLQLTATRRGTQVVHCPEGAQDAAYADLLRRIDAE